MQAEPIQPQNYFCPECYNETQAVNSKCPRCGKTMETQSSIKRRGIFLVIYGIFATLFVGLGLMIELALRLSAKRQTTFGFLMLMCFGGGLMVAITVIIAGVWQAIRGRTNKNFWRIVFGFYIFTFLCLLVGRVLDFMW